MINFSWCSMTLPISAGIAAASSSHVFLLSTTFDEVVVCLAGSAEFLSVFVVTVIGSFDQSDPSNAPAISRACGAERSEGACSSAALPCWAAHSLWVWPDMAKNIVRDDPWPVALKRGIPPRSWHGRTEPVGSRRLSCCSSDGCYDREGDWASTNRGGRHSFDL